MLIRNAEVGEFGAIDLRIAAGTIDVRIAAGAIREIGRRLEPAPREAVHEAHGGALLPGLHDHHLHLLALAAADASLRCGPPQVTSRAELESALRGASGDGWLRGIGYHDSVCGALDREALDRIGPSRPIRIQHRSGALWMLNSPAVDALRLDAGEDAPGVERNAAGRATGRVWRADGWLRERLDAGSPPALDRISRRLAAFGVCGVTDATPSNGAAELRFFEAASADGSWRQRLLLMGEAALGESATSQIARGARKFLFHEDSLPEFDALCADIAAAHDAGRNVAVHCVTRAELVYALEALEAAGPGPGGDRIEHAAVAPPELAQRMAKLGLCVVTQPNFVRERGDAYLDEVDAADLPWLYRCGELIAAGVPTGAGTDAPFGDPDPWLAMQAAVDRRTHFGRELGAHEKLTPERALALFTGPPEAPGAAPRALRVGAAADLCLLDRPWSAARDTLSSDFVAATLLGGAFVHGGEASSRGASYSKAADR